MPTFTDEQIQSLAPDTASLKAGKDLANARKWPTLAFSERALWGEVQGSGKDPYRTSVDLLNTAFKCSCPSRKFPCKHGIGLLLLYSRDQSQFKTTDEPAWVSEWMDKRAEKATKTPTAPPDAQPETPTKSKSQQKRTTERLDSVRAGVAELDRWLEDLVRTGLLSLPEKGSAFWQQTASRMVDAKAPGLANRVKQLGQLPFFDGNAWQSIALRQFGQLHLLTRAFNRLDQLPADLQADVRAAVGLTINQKDLLETPAAEQLTDRFWALARQTFVEDDLTIQRTYLHGQESGRFALLLDFAYKNTPIQTLIAPGTQTNATLVFYPGRWPYRAILKTQQGRNGTTSVQATPTGHADWSAAQQALTNVLSQSPWADEVPQHIGPLRLAINADQRYLCDTNGLSQPIARNWPDEAFFNCLALTGGQPATFFVLRYDAHVLPLGLWIEGGYHCL